jgi:hypothetical protein
MAPTLRKKATIVVTKRVMGKKAVKNSKRVLTTKTARALNVRSADVEYEPSKVTNVEYEPQKLTGTRFLVSWVGFSRRDDTWEPIENLLKCPLLVVHLEENLMKKWFVHCTRKGITSVGRKQPIHPKAYHPEILPMEYVPTGAEDVKDILTRCYTRKDEPENWDFFVVKFHKIHGTQFVRKCVMDYYFPIDVMVFLKKASLPGTSS